MIVIPLDASLFALCVLLCLGFELFRILLAFFLAADSSELKTTIAEKASVQAELALIKSIQLEFVQHSLLTRKLIKYDKKLEEIQEKQLPLRSKTRTALRVLRQCVYLCFGVYLHSKPMLMLEPNVTRAN